MYYLERTFTIFDIITFSFCTNFSHNFCNFKFMCFILVDLLYVKFTTFVDTVVSIKKSLFPIYVAFSSISITFLTMSSVCFYSVLSWIILFRISSEILTYYFNLSIWGDLVRYWLLFLWWYSWMIASFSMERTDFDGVS